MNINMDLVIDCLLIMVQGMVGIFVVILAIMLVVVILTRLCRPKPENPEDK